jgi:hypothetical protein
MSTCSSGSEVPVLQVSELLHALSPHSIGEFRTSIYSLLSLTYLKSGYRLYLRTVVDERNGSWVRR